MRLLHLSMGTLLALAAFGASVRADVGPSSSQAPYLIQAPGAPAITSISILTAGDLVGGYSMIGIPDGMGAYSNGDGTMTLVLNHELGTTSGPSHTFGTSGAFVSRWVINTTPGANFLKVISGSDLDQSVITTTAGAGTLTTFNRFCSGDLAAATAFINTASGAGTSLRIYLNGEESGTNGRAMAHVIDVNGTNTGVAYQLTAFDNLGAWENILAHPNVGNVLGNKTLVMADSDGGTRNGVYAYVGTKQATGTAIEKAGLVGGTTYSVEFTVGGLTVNENRTLALASSGAPVYSGRFKLTGITRDASGAVTSGNTASTMLRPEDGAWDPLHASDYYFVTTDQYDQAKDGVGATVGRSRLWRMRYDDITNPTAGGTVEALIDGTEPIQMLDNICVVPGADGHTRILAVEDVGGNAHNGKLWMYDTNTDELTLLAQHFASNGTIGVAATAPFNNDEEFSGIIDARDTLGLGWFLVDDQQHFAASGAQTEGGQLIAFYSAAAVGVPEPASLGVLAAGGLFMLARRRRVIR